ncbi:MAG TPA: serine/threonine-protein kinase [Kofleriaceae bacterium]|nr:serine/threonine-protein kinase [Kofleriaceae bacterium]
MADGEGVVSATAATGVSGFQPPRVSLVRRALWPSPLEEAPGPARVDTFARLRGLFTLISIAVDVGVYLGFRGSSHFNATMLRWFFFLNVPLLAVSAILCFFVLRRRSRWYTPAQLVSLTFEMFTSIVWIQLTGSVSSYFLIVVPVLILAYRLYATYRLGLIVYVLGAALHAGAVVLEGLHVLAPAPLFASNPGAVYDDPLFRVAAAVSIQFMFLAIFMLANLVSRALREKETELDVVQRNFDRMIAEVQPGRLSGQTLDGKYKLRELLGRGGMGEVYQAERGTDELAVKVLYQHLCGDDDLARFRREAAVVAKLPSEHVARVYEIGRCAQTGHNYLAMELLRGEDLGMLLRRRGKLPSAELLPIVDQLATGLEAVHAAGVVHRDLKPQNVFLSATGGVKLLDFGVARLVEGSELTRSQMLIGSPGYLAPEQVMSALGEVGPRADVFALGTLIYRALTGHSAFPARSTAAAVYEAVHVDPPPPSTVDASLPADLDLVLALALAKKPQQRYATPRELAIDLRAAFAGSLDEASRDRAAAIDKRRSAPGFAPTLAQPSS